MNLSNTQRTILTMLAAYLLAVLLMAWFASRRITEDQYWNAFNEGYYEGRRDAAEDEYGLCEYTIVEWHPEMRQCFADVWREEREARDRADEQARREHGFQGR